MTWLYGDEAGDRGGVGPLGSRMTDEEIIARLRTEAVERAAAVMHRQHFGADSTTPWAGEPERYKQVWREQAAEVLAAAVGRALGRSGGAPEPTIEALRAIRDDILPEFLRDHPGSYRAIALLHEALRLADPAPTQEKTDGDMDKHSMGRAAPPTGTQEVVGADPAPEPPREQATPEDKAKLREHIRTYFKDSGPDQKIKLTLPRWLWDDLLRAGGDPPTDARQCLREAMEVLAIHAHLDRGASLPEDREPPGEYEGKAWWELPEEAKRHFRELIERVHPTWVAALREGETKP